MKQVHAKNGGIADMLRNAVRVYLFGLGLGLRLICAGMVVEGIRLLIANIGYWRFLPNGIVLEHLSRTEKARILDLSSPKLLSIFLAAKTKGAVLSTDLSDEKIFCRWKKAADVIGLTNYNVEYQDGRTLSYPDSYFDFAYSISVMEHIPDDGDTKSLGELFRVLKPNAKLVIEVPYRRRGKDVLRKCDSRGKQVRVPQFYERHYDAGSLNSRLRFSGLKLQETILLGEWLPIDPLIAGDLLPRWLRIAFMPWEPLLAILNYWSRQNGKHYGRPLAAVLVYTVEKRTEVQPAISCK